MTDYAMLAGIFVAIMWGIFSATVLIPYFVVRELKKGRFDNKLVDIGTRIAARIGQGDVQNSDGKTKAKDVDFNAIAEKLGSALEGKAKPPSSKGSGSLKGGLDPNLLGSIGGLVKQIQSDPATMKNLMGAMPEDMQQGVLVEGLKDIVPVEWRKYVKNPLIQMFLQRILSNAMSGGNSGKGVSLMGSGSISAGSSYNQRYVKV